MSELIDAIKTMCHPTTRRGFYFAGTLFEVEYDSMEAVCGIYEPGSKFNLIDWINSHWVVRAQEMLDDALEEETAAHRHHVRFDT